MVMLPAAPVRVPAAVTAKASFGSRESAVALVRVRLPPLRVRAPASLMTGAAPRLAADEAMSVPVLPMLMPPVNVLVPDRVIVPPVP